MPKAAWYSPTRLLRSAYVKRLRPLLPPTAPIRLAGIPGPDDRKLGDGTLGRLAAPGIGEDAPDYEEALSRGLRLHVRPGDRVVVVGGGLGITAALSALLVGTAGQVTCYEGNANGRARILRTLERNGVAGRVDLRIAVVGQLNYVYGTSTDAVVRPQELPDCDVLELDCEGSEIGILADMTIRPRAILVETHGMYGATSVDVTHRLEAIGYAVTDLGWAEPGLQEICERDDIRVLAGIRR